LKCKFFKLKLFRIAQFDIPAQLMLWNYYWCNLILFWTFSKLKLPVFDCYRHSTVLGKILFLMPVPDNFGTLQYSEILVCVTSIFGYFALPDRPCKMKIFVRFYAGSMFVLLTGSISTTWTIMACSSKWVSINNRRFIKKIHGPLG